ncbi:MAG: Dam family site-specific DNA-(adenine-N6)-methyltransferase [Caulobacter sp.]|nr:Dam family site-specific DNA-(adenine-N6)-methyltransferase [Caulobacter sp.]
MNYHPPASAVRAKAFLRWAGGKSWLVPRIEALFGSLSFARYHEPFLGGASFFFAVASGADALLSDKNEALIEVYECLKADPFRVIEYMLPLENTKECYYATRDARPTRDYERAAHFIYLNHTSFNGIYRVNLNGVYNVPYGYRTKPFLDEAALIAASRALRQATLRSCDFDETLGQVGPGDLVFIDPPYTVSHNNNGFIKYNKHLFALEDQHRLCKYIKSVRDAGANYIMTNAAHPIITEIFELGGRMVEVSRASLIGGRNASRGAVSEFLFTNLEIEKNDDPE